MKLLLFDIDGTLLLTGGVGAIAFDLAFEEVFGIPDIWGDTRPHGKTDPAIIEEIVQKGLRRRLTKEEYRKLCERYHHHFKREIKCAPRFRLMPGIQNLLAALAKQKNHYLLGLATGNFEEASWLKLKHGSIHRHFKFGGFGSDSHNRTQLTRAAILRGEKIAKQRFRRKDIFIIGDTDKDIAVGKNLGVKIIAVATGGHTLKELAPHKPDYLLKDLSCVSDFLKIVNSPA